MHLRRIVTADDERLVSHIVDDGPTRTVTAPTTPEGVSVAVLWVTESSPVVPAASEDPQSASWNLGALAPSGTRWSMIEIQPGANAQGMHRTTTLDYVMIVSGEIWLVMGGGEEVLLKTGDCVVQQGTEHAWQNRSAMPCVMTSVMLNAQ